MELELLQSLLPGALPSAALIWAFHRLDKRLTRVEALLELHPMWGSK